MAVVDAPRRTSSVAMRTKRTTQISLLDTQAIDHPVADDLEWASAWLDQLPELLDEIATDVDGKAASRRGRHGLICETALRCAMLMHLRQASYREPAFTLNDSLTARRFARLDPTRKASARYAMVRRRPLLRGATRSCMVRAAFSTCERSSSGGGESPVEGADPQSDA